MVRALAFNRAVRKPKRTTNLRRPCPVRSNLFNWHVNKPLGPHQIIGSGELSTLFGPLRERLKLSGDGIPFEQVYNDACDEGITIISQISGQEVVFVVVDRDFNRDNEIEGWLLEAVTPGPMKGKKILIIND